MEKTNTEWISMTDATIVQAIGQFVKQKRLQANKTQSLLAKEAGLNPYTISQIENGVSVTLSTLIQMLRVLDALYVLDNFKIIEEISPIQYAKMQKGKRQRARSNKKPDTSKNDIGW
ncbi:MAG TPA: helix-turn-helix transcriptional regulator [Bacteroidales bacterium]|nr:helix-turn-helix transcriptional regulator [Bacteroidales bacterium]